MAGTAARVELNATFFAQVHAVSGRLVYAVRNRFQVLPSLLDLSNRLSNESSHH